MRPAFSVVFFTTLAGAGQGLFVALYAVEIAGWRGGLPVQDGPFFVSGSAISLLLLAAGLAASFFHLGRPGRAWRSAAMWRTSWLSREVIVLPAFMACVLAYGAAHHFGLRSTGAIGAAALSVCFALFLCTGMIYACIRFLQEWATPLTVVNYILLGCASGFTLATAFAAAQGREDLAPPLGGWAAALTAAAATTRIAALVRNARLRPKSTLQTAIGIEHPHIAQKSQGFMGGSFNTREFFHGRRAGMVRLVRWTFLSLSFPVPLALLAAGVAGASQTLLAGAFVVQYLGLIAERWYFFAQANHPQNLYYQAIS